MNICIRHSSPHLRIKTSEPNFRIKLILYITAEVTTLGAYDRLLCSLVFMFLAYVFVGLPYFSLYCLLCSLLCLCSILYCLECLTYYSVLCTNIPHDLLIDCLYIIVHDQKSHIR